MTKSRTATTLSKFSFIGNQALVGRMIASLIPRDLVLPVPQGALRGKKWIVRSGGLSFYLGTHEYGNQGLFHKEVLPGDTVYDVGANVGFFTLLASELVGGHGKVVAFEPLPQNLKFLRKHIELNGLANVQVIDKAVANANGRVLFSCGDGSSTAHISDKGEIEVDAVSLDSLIEKRAIPPPDFVKIDVEGAESLVLTGAKRILDEYCPCILLSTHAPVVQAANCLSLLRSSGYDTTSLSGNAEKVGGDYFARKKKGV